MKDAVLRASAAASSSTRPPHYSVALQVNEGYYDLFCNWLHHFRTLGTSNEVWALVYGNHTYEVVARQLTPFYVMKAGVSIDGFHHFNSQSFNRLAFDKIQLMKDVLDRTSKPVVFTDIDTVWLHNPFIKFAMPRGIAAVPEGYVHERTKETVLFNFCTCFVVATHSRSSRAFLDRWQRFLSGDHSGAAAEEGDGPDGLQQQKG